MVIELKLTGLNRNIPYYYKPSFYGYDEFVFTVKPAFMCFTFITMELNTLYLRF
jgi:hypothetical protein